MLLENSPVDTSNYLILGFTILTIISGGYCIYLFNRFRKLKQQISILEESNNTHNRDT
jgi:hypothetical protein